MAFKINFELIASSRQNRASDRSITRHRAVHRVATAHRVASLRCLAGRSPAPLLEPPPTNHSRQSRRYRPRHAAVGLQAVSPRCVAPPRSRAIAADPTLSRAVAASPAQLFTGVAEPPSSAPRSCPVPGRRLHRSRTSPSHRGSASRSHRAHLPVSSPICRRREPLLGRWPSAPASSLACRCTGSSRLRITREPRRFAPAGAPPRACCPSSATAADRCRHRVCRGSRHPREFASCRDVVSLLRSLALSLSLSSLF
ncbi:hypothetical protein Scep_007368 [Stephania cephalantha]|uniref:Uncharacterized protein n=1 Tax=Stephania cephalantha TaxID=152367 RepID=A0AAP0K9Q7_9MAGN